MFFDMSNGSGLAFRVKAYATEEEMLASAPGENTIGVEVDSYDGYVICATAPENPTEGMLWIQVDSASPVKFLATRKNSIYIHPIKAYIYHTPEDETDTGWNVVVAYLYANAAWSLFGRQFFYRNLKLNGNFADTMQTVPTGYSSDKVSGCAMKTNEYGIVLDCTKDTFGDKAANGQHILFWDKKTNRLSHDLTHFKTLTFTGLFDYENSNSSVIYGVWNKSGDGENYQKDIAASAKITTNNTDPVVIDVSALEGEYYIGLGIRSARVRIDECYLEM